MDLVWVWLFWVLGWVLKWVRYWVQNWVIRFGPFHTRAWFWVHQPSGPLPFTLRSKITRVFQPSLYDASHKRRTFWKHLGQKGSRNDPNTKSHNLPMPTQKGAAEQHGGGDDKGKPSALTRHSHE